MQSINTFRGIFHITVLFCFFLAFYLVSCVFPSPLEALVVGRFLVLQSNKERKTDTEVVVQALLRPKLWIGKDSLAASAGFLCRTAPHERGSLCDGVVVCSA